MKKLFYIVIAIGIIFIAGCSSSEETTKQQEEENEPEIYVFDDVTDDIDTTEIKTPVETDISEPVNTNQNNYYVQVGAFTSQDRAKQFVDENRSKTNYQLNITYSEDVQLYVVQIPPFSTRAEAEKIRNEFWQSGLFKDAFILTK